MNKKRNIIIVVISLIILIVLALVILYDPLNAISNISKIQETQTSKMQTGATSDELFKNAYYDEEAGVVKGLTPEEQKIMDNVTSQVQQYLSDENAKSDIEEVTNNQIESAIKDIATNQLENLKDKALNQVGDQLIKNAGDIITDNMIDAVKKDGDLGKALTNGIGDLLGDLKGGVISYAKGEIYNQLTDKIDNEVARFIISNVGKEMVNDLLSGNVTDVFTKFGGNLMGSITNGIKDFINFKIADKIFGSLSDPLKILLGDKLNIVGKIGNIIGIDLGKVIGLPSKIINGAVDKIKGIFSDQIGGKVVDKITDGVETYVGSLGDGLTDAITGGITNIIPTSTLLGTVASVINPNPKPMSLDKIPYEELIKNKYLFCVEHGKHLPARKGVDNVQDSLEGSGFNQKDATLSDFSFLGYPSPIFEGVEDLKIIGRVVPTTPGYEPGALSGMQADKIINIGIPKAPPSPFVTESQNKIVTTHTIGKYISTPKNLSAMEAYILSHDKDIKRLAYPDVVQQALWFALDRMGIKSPSKPTEGNGANKEVARSLFREAVALDNSIKALKQFKLKNAGKILVDQTNYWMNND